jgi:hypothetical protein
MVRPECKTLQIIHPRLIRGKRMKSCSDRDAVRPQVLGWPNLKAGASTVC